MNPAEIPRVDAFEDTLPQPFLWARQHDENWSLLDPSKLKHQSELPMQKLAKLSLFVVLKRVDSNRWAMDMCLVPREAGISSAQLASCHSRSREHTTEQYQVLGCS